ncbi:DUF1302 domain-containing protein [Synoicihabitans lomoniglobus]|uniref:DUF1302 domain-containing protein n=1 Tax=Synoicihabitans lomoniglobus TaxID=2909285 RepID=A0AAF0CQW4_9BACT|nr:DUF1302 domain-containing protein [Opitutaceae bacterium LMO-M01]WED66429.1 DUF1302 domain-containing protein [Opitutaceae bacterium LMO-M01]
MQRIVTTRRWWLAGSLLITSSLGAITFTEGDLSGSWDTTISAGGIYRLDDPDPDLYGTSNGGNANSVNTDDGNLNFTDGWVSKAFKVTSELELTYGDHLGFFTRGSWLYDDAVEGANNLRKPLRAEALDRAGNRLDYFDLYGVVRFDVGDTPVDVRLGRQVLSLGESTFLPNGNNIVNPVEVANLRVPGAELREGFLPVNMLKVSADLTYNLSVEAFWLLEFRHTEIEPAGTYFSTNDFASRGGDMVFLGFGALPDTGTLGAIPRGRDDEGNNYNQWGLALRYLAPGLNDTEFGVYFAKFHSRLPLINAITPARPISSAEVQGTASAIAQQQLVPAMIANGVPAQAIPSILPTLLGAALTNVPAAAIPGIPSLAPFAAFYPAAQSIAAGAKQVGLLNAAATANYFIEYPEDITMLGASFNADLANLGVAWQGEVSYKHDMPLQVDDVELLFAALSTLAPQFGANNQVGDYLGQYGTIVRGHRRHDVWTAQSTMTKVFGPTLGASSLTVLGEVGGLWADLPAKDVLRYEVSGTYTSGNQASMIGTGSALPATPLSYFADDFAWGYQLLARLEYNNLFAGINVLPTIAFSHDVTGNSPAPLSNYLEGRKSLSLSTEFVFQNTWSADIRYVNYFGGGVQNLLGDRDFFATTIKYSF